MSKIVTIPPRVDEAFIRFRNEEEKLEKLFGWELITKTAKSKGIIKAFIYYGTGMDEAVPCEVVGYIPYDIFLDARDTVVVEIDKQLHKVMPEYLKEMQTGNAESKNKNDMDDSSQKESTSTDDVEAQKSKQTNIINKLNNQESFHINELNNQESVCKGEIDELEDQALKNINNTNKLGNQVLLGREGAGIQLELSELLIGKSSKAYDFVTIDFETANNNMNSACSVGIVAVENNQIVDKKYFLIKPPILHFEEENIKIHGIRPEDVAGQGTFKDVWNEIEFYISHNLLVAHNASFDMSVLKCCFEAYGIPVPDTEYVCSIDISSYAFESKVPRSLGERTKLLGISLENAHNALDDAVACAELVIKTLEINEKTSLHKFLSSHRAINVKHLHELKEQKTFKKGARKSSGESSSKSSRFKNNVRIADLEVTAQEIDKNNPVYEKHFVFTGDLQAMSREACMQSVVNLGGVVKSGISKKVNYLVVGKQDLSLVGESGMSTKEKKAYTLKEQGVNINIINEQEFLRLITANQECASDLQEESVNDTQEDSIQEDRVAHSVNDSQKEDGIIEGNVEEGAISETIEDNTIFNTVSDILKKEEKSLDGLTIKEITNGFNIKLYTETLFKVNTEKQLYFYVKKEFKDQVKAYFEVQEVKNLIGWVRFELKSIEQLNQIHQIIVATYEEATVSDEFACCYLYNECSEQGKCISLRVERSRACIYRKNLEAGINFYK